MVGGAETFGGVPRVTPLVNLLVFAWNVISFVFPVIFYKGSVVKSTQLIEIYPITTFPGTCTTLWYKKSYCTVQSTESHIFIDDDWQHRWPWPWQNNYNPPPRCHIPRRPMVVKASGIHNMQPQLTKVLPMFCDAQSGCPSSVSWCSSTRQLLSWSSWIRLSTPSIRLDMTKKKQPASLRSSLP